LGWQHGRREAQPNFAGRTDFVVRVAKPQADNAMILFVQVMSDL
jgi:hypothetical protein